MCLPGLRSHRDWQAVQLWCRQTRTLAHTLSWGCRDSQGKERSRSLHQACEQVHPGVCRVGGVLSVRLSPRQKMNLVPADVGPLLCGSSQNTSRSCAGLLRGQAGAYRRQRGCLWGQSVVPHAHLPKAPSAQGHPYCPPVPPGFQEKEAVNTQNASCSPRWASIYFTSP